MQFAAIARRGHFIAKGRTSDWQIPNFDILITAELH